MAKPSQKSSSSPSSLSAATPAAYRIWFVPGPGSAERAAAVETGASAKSATADAAARGESFRRFADPSAAVAKRQSLPLDSVLQPDGAEARGDELHIIYLPPGTPESEVQSAQRWLSGKGRARPVRAQSAELTLLFRPGRAVITGSAEQLDEALAALTDFAFYEGQLRKLEAEVARDWPEVEADLPYVSKLDDGSKKLWPALYRKLAHQHWLGMAAARIEHRVTLITEERSPELAKLLARLRVRARLPTRLEQLQSQLEVRDGVYDQIGYRLSDHRQLRASLIIEVVIVVLLLMEVGISLFNLIDGVQH